MKVSARNVFEGRVANVRAGAVNAEVDVTLPGGETLVAVITLGSATELGLAAGSPVYALVKAPWVMIMVDGDDIRLSARNCFAGTVTSVEPGAVNAEVVIRLPGGTDVVAVVTMESVQSLGLRPGVAATAVIKASSVILAVPA